MIKGVEFISKYNLSNYVLIIKVITQFGLVKSCWHLQMSHNFRNVNHF